MPCSSSASRWLRPGPCDWPSSKFSDDVEPGAVPFLSASCTATLNIFDTALRMAGLEELAKTSLILSCKLSYLVEK